MGTWSDTGDITTDEVDGNEENDRFGGVGEEIEGDSLGSTCKNFRILKQMQEKIK